MRSRVLVLCWSLSFACGACGGARGEVMAASDPARNEGQATEPSPAEAARSEPVEEVEPVAVPSSEAASPTDIDRDAIADAVDACPEEAEVYNDHDDEDGCPDCMGSIILTDVWELPRVEFVPVGREQPTRSARDPRAGSIDAPRVLHSWEIDFTAAVILAHAEYAQVEIAGSARRGERDPRALSSARAEVVREALIARGVPAERLVTSARGVTDDGARVRFVVTRRGSAYPLCNTPFPGCSASMVASYVLDWVWFAPGSAQIEDARGPILDQVVGRVASALEVEPLEVLGYVGRRERHPEALALARANAVLEALVARGLPRERLVARAMGRHDVDAPGGAVRFGRAIATGCRGIPAPEPERAR